MQCNGTNSSGNHCNKNHFYCSHCIQDTVRSVLQHFPVLLSCTKSGYCTRPPCAIVLYSILFNTPLYYCIVLYRILYYCTVQNAVWTVQQHPPVLLYCTVYRMLFGLYNNTPLYYCTVQDAVWSVLQHPPVLLYCTRCCLDGTTTPSCTTVLYRMLFGLYYNTPLITGCQGSSLFSAFSQFLLHRLRIPVQPPSYKLRSEGYLFQMHKSPEIFFI